MAHNLDNAFATDSPAAPGTTVGCLSPGWCSHEDCRKRHEAVRAHNGAIARFVAANADIASLTPALAFATRLYISAASGYGAARREFAALEDGDGCHCDDESRYICHACCVEDAMRFARSDMRLRAERVAHEFEQARGAR